MSEPAPPEKEPGPSGCLGGLAIGVATVAVFSGATGNGLNLSEEWPFLLFFLCLAAAPFVLLASMGVSAKLPWVVALGLHLIAWGALFLIVFSQRGEGAIIGVGLLMLACPILVTAGSLVAAKLIGSIPEA